MGGEKTEGVDAALERGGFSLRHSFKRLIVDSNHNKRRIFRTIRIAPRPIGFAECKASKIDGLNHVAFARHRRQRVVFCYSHSGTIGKQWPHHQTFDGRQ
jgi:hypothetical protein